MTPLSTLSKIRNKIAKNGGSEISEFQTDNDLKELWQSKQELLTAMNKAKKEAAEKAAEPYLNLIRDIDEQYAVLLQFKDIKGKN